MPFETITQTAINPAHRGIQGQVTLSEGGTLAGKLQALVQSNPPVGSELEKQKQYLTRTVPAGKQVKINIIFVTSSIEDI